MFGRAEQRLVGSEQSLNAGAHRVAIIEAGAAVDLARVVEPSLGEEAACAELDRLRELALQPKGQVDEALAGHAVEIANSLLSLVRPPSEPSP